MRVRGFSRPLHPFSRYSTEYPANLAGRTKILEVKHARHKRSNTWRNSAVMYLVLTAPSFLKNGKYCRELIALIALIQIWLLALD